MQYVHYSNEIKKLTDSLPRRRRIQKSDIETLEQIVISGYNSAPHEARLKEACDYAVTNGKPLPLDFSEEELNFFINDK